MTSKPQPSKTMGPRPPPVNPPLTTTIGYTLMQLTPLHQSNKENS